MKVCTNKTCTNGSGPLPLDQFYSDAQKKDGLSSRCRRCLDADSRRRATSNPRHHARIRWAVNLRHAYGLSVEEYARLLYRANLRCEICESPFSDTTSPHVDHDHSTGDVRGLLCKTCNLGLGSFKDSVSNLESAIRYIERS